MCTISAVPGGSVRSDTDPAAGWEDGADRRRGEAVASQGFDEGWFEAARDLVAGLPDRPGLDCSLQFEADGLRWRQVVVAGRVADWSLGEVADPDLVVRMPLDAARAAHRPDADGDEALARCTLVLPDGREGPAPPLDLPAHPDLDSVPEVPGADLTVQFHLARGPFGDVNAWQSTVDGRLDEMGLGELEEPDIVIGASYRAMAELRAGTRTLLELLADGATVRGEEGPLMLFAGLEEAPELQAVKRSCSRSATVLGALGEVRADPVFQAALAALTEGPR